MESKVMVDLEGEAATISSDMRKLYSDFASGVIKREDADTLANIAGKNLKALAIVFANRLLENVHLPKLVLAQEKPPLEHKPNKPKAKK